MSKFKYLTLNTYLLFNNEYLNTMTILCIMYNLRKKRNGSLENEVIFYYSIISSEINIDISEKQMKVYRDKCKYDVDIKYIELLNETKKYINILLARGYLELGRVDKEEIRLKISKQGVDIVKSLNSIYYKEIIELGSYLIKNLKFNKKNFFNIIGVKL